MPQFLSLAPRLAATIFFAAATTFFVLNPAAFQKLNALNVLQFNLQGVDYAFIMALFAYALPGALLTGYFGWHLLHSPARLRGPAALLALASTLLIQLGTIATAPAYPSRTRYLMVISWLFPALHGAAWVWLALSIQRQRSTLFWRPGEWQRIVNATLGLYLLYCMPGSFLFGADEIQANVPIALCFGWYASCHALFQASSPPTVA